MFFENKLCVFWKIAKGSKFTVECNLIIRISQNFKNLGFWLKKQMGFSKNLWLFFQKSLKVAKLHNKATEKKDSQNVPKLGVFLEEMDGTFLTKKILFFKKLIKVANFQKNATEIVTFLNTFKEWDFENKIGYWEKTLRFLKSAKGRNFVVECNWISRFSPNIWKFRFFASKK